MLAHIGITVPNEYEENSVDLSSDIPVWSRLHINSPWKKIRKVERFYNRL